MYAEVVRGLGESIVSGLVPGSALGCVISKGDLDNPEVCTTSQTLCTLSWDLSLLCSGPCSAVPRHAPWVLSPSWVMKSSAAGLPKSSGSHRWDVVCDSCCDGCPISCPYAPLVVGFPWTIWGRYAGCAQGSKC